VTLPLLISVPHAGLKVPPEVESICTLNQEQIVEDGDEGAAEIYSVGDQVAAFVTTDVARAFVDVSRAQDDRRADGVVKTHTIWEIPIYSQALSEELVKALLRRYYRPYHQELSRLARKVRMGVDCHTMAEVGPPIGPGAGEKRPLICLSNAEGSCPDAWFKSFAECLERSFEVKVSLNSPFKGGYIIRSHAHELPWIQVELSREPFLTIAEKRQRFLAALTQWHHTVLS
jgi:N-formylglutamate deformylase